MADQQEILNTILLTRLNYFSLAGMLELYRKVGSATLILEHKNNLRDILPDASDKLVNAIQNCDEARKRAEEELEYDIRYGIEPITMNDERYPQRLKDCDDAPLMLFYKGNANLNQQRVINIVGTRHCTPYGEDLIRRFITDLKQLSPNGSSQISRRSRIRGQNIPITQPSNPPFLSSTTTLTPPTPTNPSLRTITSITLTHSYSNPKQHTPLQLTNTTRTTLLFHNQHLFLINTLALKHALISSATKSAEHALTSVSNSTNIEYAATPCPAPFFTMSSLQLTM